MQNTKLLHFTSQRDLFFDPIVCDAEGRHALLLYYHARTFDVGSARAGYMGVSRCGNSFYIVY
jgi:hypothetical protein